MYAYDSSFYGFDVSTELTNLFHQATPKLTKTLLEVNSSEDSEQTMIFSRPNPKTPSKPTVGKKKGATQKTIPLKETMTSTVSPSNKGKGKEDLSIPDDRVQDELKDLPIREQDTRKVFLYITHKL